MGIRSNKVGGDIKGKREREKMRISREMFNFKKLDKEEKKKRCPREVNLGRHNSTHSFIFSKTSNWVLSAATPLVVSPFENSLNLTAKR